MAKYSIILKIPESNKADILESISKIYSKSKGSQFAHKSNELRYIFKITTSDTREIVKNNLTKIPDLSVVSVVSESNIVPKLPKKFSVWLMLGLLLGWIVISYIAFFVAENFIDTLTPSQLLVVQISIAFLISIWIFLYDKRTQQDVIDVLATLDLRTSEINENVKDLDDSN